LIRSKVESRISDGTRWGDLAFHDELSTSARARRKSERRKQGLLDINNAIVTNLTKDALHHAICEALRSFLPLDLG
jgi:hypothetical protein